MTLAIGGAIFASIYFSQKKAARSAWIFFALVMSHWVLDAISHPPDMRIAPGINTVVRLGLWQSLPATMIVEGGLWAVAIIIYLRSTRAKSRGGIYGFWIITALLTYIWVINIRRGVDHDAIRAGIGGCIVFGVFVMWMYWINRARDGKLRIVFRPKFIGLEYRPHDSCASRNEQRARGAPPRRCERPIGFLRSGAFPFPLFPSANQNPIRESRCEAFQQTCLALYCLTSRPMSTAKVRIATATTVLLSNTRLVAT